MAVGFVFLTRFFAEADLGLRTSDLGLTPGSPKLGTRNSELGTLIAIHRRGKIVSLALAAERVGLKVGMRLREAQAVAPEVEFVPFLEDHYQAPWQRVLALCARHVSCLEPVAPGEAFLDLPELRSGGPAQSLAEIQRTIERETRFTCVVGGGPSKLVAQIAAEVAPGKVVAPEEAASFLAPLPIGKMCLTHFSRSRNMSDTFFRQLQDLGLTTIGLLQRVSVARLAEQFGREARQLVELAQGIDHSPVQPLYPPRTLAVRLALPEGVGDREAIDRGLRKLSARIAAGLQEREETCSRLSLRLEVEGGLAMARALRLRRPAAQGDEILRLARHLLSRLEIAALVTALELHASDFQRFVSRQLDLFAHTEKGVRHVVPATSGEKVSDTFFRTQEALASVHEHFGHQAALTAAEIELPRRERMLMAL